MLVLHRVVKARKTLSAEHFGKEHIGILAPEFHICKVNQDNYTMEIVEIRLWQVNIPLHAKQFSLLHFGLIGQVFGRIGEQHYLLGSTVSIVVSENTARLQCLAVKLGILVSSTVIQHDSISILGDIKMIELVTHQADRHHCAIGLGHGDKPPMSGNSKGLNTQEGCSKLQ